MSGLIAQSAFGFWTFTASLAVDMHCLHMSVPGGTTAARTTMGAIQPLQLLSGLWADLHVMLTYVWTQLVRLLKYDCYGMVRLLCATI
jgi:hypothetical protein